MASYGLLAGPAVRRTLAPRPTLRRLIAAADPNLFTFISLLVTCGLGSLLLCARPVSGGGGDGGGGGLTRLRPPGSVLLFGRVEAAPGGGGARGGGPAAWEKTRCLALTFSLEGDEEKTAVVCRDRMPPQPPGGTAAAAGAPTARYNFLFRLGAVGGYGVVTVRTAPGANARSGSGPRSPCVLSRTAVVLTGSSVEVVVVLPVESLLACESPPSSYGGAAAAVLATTNFFSVSSSRSGGRSGGDGGSSLTLLGLQLTRLPLAVGVLVALAAAAVLVPVAAHLRRGARRRGRQHRAQQRSLVCAAAAFEAGPSSPFPPLLELPRPFWIYQPVTSCCPFLPPRLAAPDAAPYLLQHHHPSTSSSPLLFNRHLSISEVLSGGTQLVLGCQGRAA